MTIPLFYTALVLISTWIAYALGRRDGREIYINQRCREETAKWLAKELRRINGLPDE